jgi:tRNA threonylcarbamoyl adenosine modification protein YeaZ
VIVLGIDTAGPRVAAAIVRGGALAAARSTPGGREGAPRLAALLDELLEEAGVLPGALDGIAACTGPGPFTALRVGLAAAAGLALATGCQALGIPSHRALVAGMGAAGGPFLPVLDAGRGEVWTPLDAASDEGRLQTPEVLAAGLAGTPRPQLVGPGAERHRERFEELLGEGAVASRSPTAAAEGAAHLGLRVIEDGGGAPLRPLYARSPDAVAPRRPR